MTDAVHYQREGRIAVLTLDRPPINALGHELRSALHDAFRRAQEDAGAEAIVIASRTRAFCGGADIGEFGSELTWRSPTLPELCDALEASAKPVVAALHGVALGGGLELALACDYRLADAGTRLGLPEVHLGLIPGAGGTQRLPRIAGVALALEMITSGKPISAAKAQAIGLIDRLVDEDPQVAALAYAEELLETGAPRRPCAGINVDTSGLGDDHFAEVREGLGAKTQGYVAPLACVDAVEEACRLPLDAGLAREREIFQACLDTPQARAQQHLFFAERQATRVPGVDPATPTRPIARVGIIGAGTMGGGIAMNFANAGIPVTLVEREAAALERGLATIRKHYEASARKGRLSEAQVEERMALLEGSLDDTALADADLVVEAVFESLEVKRQVFERLDAVCKPGAILASNTSTLDLDAIAGFTRRPQDVIGLHFFSPANVMRLLEIVRGAATADDVITTALKLARTIGKLPVVVGVCFGFVGNRMLEPYAREAHRLVLEGASPAQVDGALTGFGLAMGPLAMYDLAGIDVGYQVRESRREAIAHDPSYNLIGDRLYALGRYGQKTGRGFYRYEGRERLPDPEVDALAAEIAAELGIERREIGDEEIVARCVGMLVNEAADILEEGIAYRSGDCDLVWVNGYGFPAWRGGPLRYADEIGPARVLADIERHRDRLGAYGEMWFTPSPLLRRLVDEGRAFADLAPATAVS
ncbi:enoyl-CoA hydratase/isomerase family protein [Halomonas organivorans]